MAGFGSWVLLYSWSSWLYIRYVVVGSPIKGITVGVGLCKMSIAMVR